MNASLRSGKSVAPLLVVLAAAGLVGVVAVWVVQSKRPAPPPQNEAAPVNVEVRVVRAIPVMPDTFELPAVVEPNRVVKVSAEVAGRIERIHCKEGERCAARRNGGPDGAQPLIELNTELLQAEFDRAAAGAKLAEENHKRIDRLAKQGGATEQDVDKVKAAMLTSKADEELARVRLERARIFPPISGVLNDLLVEEGEYVQAGTAVAEIVEVDRVKIVVPVPELDVPFLKVGDKAAVLANRNGGAPEFPGAVSYISARADMNTRATRVEITLDNRERLLRSGQIVRVRLLRRALKDVIMVPLGAVIPLEQGKVVYVVEDGKAQRRRVRVNAGFIKTEEEPGANGNGPRKTQIIWVMPWPEGDPRKGLKDGDRLIVRGHHLVASGQPVRVRKPAPTAGSAKAGGPSPE